jgi:hypothetical protein
LHGAPLHDACKNQPLIPHASMAVKEGSHRYVAGSQSARGRTVAVAVARSAAKVRTEKCMVAGVSCLSFEMWRPVASCQTYRGYCGFGRLGFGIDV